MTPARPNFFIVGAPKSGTTSLSEYLREHPEVCFSRPKEPHYFATDLPGYRGMTSEERYLEHCYGHCTDDCAAVGEGSVYYLFSREAVPNILEFDPDSRFIAMVRNPADLAYALHQQMIYSGFEDEPDFEAAWELQAVRRQGRRVPETCWDPAVLQYRDVASVGSQLERLLELAPEEQVHVILFDDFVGRTRDVYEGVLRFLGLTSDGRKHFPRINPGRAHRLPLLARLIHNPPDVLVRAAGKVKRTLGIPELGVLSAVERWNTVERDRPPLRPEFRRRLVREFQEEVSKVEAICGRPLPEWREE